MRCDIGIERDVEKAMASTLERFATVDCLPSRMPPLRRAFRSSQLDLKIGKG